MSANNTKDKASTVLTVRVPDFLKDQLDYLSRTTKRSKGYLAAEALGDFVKRNAWRAKELQEAIIEAEKGVFVSHDAMLVWVNDATSGAYSTPPTPDIAF